MRFYDDARLDFAQLIEADEATNGHPELPSGSRQRVQDALELVLINPDAWSVHCDLLRDRLQVERHRGLLGNRREVCMSGLAVLNGLQLAKLALNRNGLRDLTQALDVLSPIPEIWMEATSRHGRQILKERELTELRGSQLIDAAIKELGNDR